MLLAYPSSLWDPLWLFFLCLLILFHNLLFLLESTNPSHVQICCILCPVCTLNIISLFSLLPLKLVLSMSAFLQLTVVSWEASSFSLCPISSYPTPALLYITSCISTSQGLCYHSRPVFLHITSWCYGCLHLIPHRITACSYHSYKLWLIITQREKWKQSKSDVGTRSNREIAVTAKLSETKLSRVKKSSDKANLARLSPENS